MTKYTRTGAHQQTFPIAFLLFGRFPPAYHFFVALF